MNHKGQIKTVYLSTLIFLVISTGSTLSIVAPTDHFNQLCNNQSQTEVPDIYTAEIDNQTVDTIECSQLSEYEFDTNQTKADQLMQPDHVTQTPLKKAINWITGLIKTISDQIF